MANNKILYLESLRGIAALSVAIFHFDNNSFFNNSFTRNGWLMVDFFFILSGFVISLNYQNKILKLTDIFKFQFKRFLRLYPLHLIMLIVFLFIEIAKYIVNSKLGITPNNLPFSINNFETFILNLFLLQNLFSEYLSWNVQSWSISSEFYTYLIFGFLTVFLFRNKTMIYITSFLIVLLTFFILYKTSMETSNGFVRCLYSFFLGVIIFNLSNFLQYRITNVFSYLFFILAIVAVIFSEGEKEIGLNIFVPIFFSIFILSLLISNDKNFIKILLNNKFLVYLGTISYGIYMTHTAVWWIINQSLRFLFNYQIFVNQEGATKVVFENTFLASFVMLIGLTIIVLVSHLSFKLVEMPINRKKDKIKFTN